jgi:hypothetical protein
LRCAWNAKEAPGPLLLLRGFPCLLCDCAADQGKGNA